LEIHNLCFTAGVVNFTQTTTTTPEPNAIGAEDLHCLHRILSNPSNLQTLITGIGNRDAAAQFTKLLEQLGSYQSKISFAFLGESDRKLVASVLQAQHDEAQYIGEWFTTGKDPNSFLQDDGDAVVTAADASQDAKAKRILIVGQHRIICLKPGNNKPKAAHMLDLQELRSPNQAVIAFKFKHFSIMLRARPGPEGENADAVIQCVQESFDVSFLLCSFVVVVVVCCFLVCCADQRCSGKFCGNALQTAL
jgi:hypothetical protein